jgi:hypothetical protein
VEHNFTHKDIVVELIVKDALKMDEVAVEPLKLEQVLILTHQKDQKVVMVFLHQSTERQLTTQVVEEPVYGEHIDLLADQVVLAVVEKVETPVVLQELTEQQTEEPVVVAVETANQQVVTEVLVL